MWVYLITLIWLGIALYFLTKDKTSHWNNQWISTDKINSSENTLLTSDIKVNDILKEQWMPNLSNFYKKSYFFTRNEYYFFKRLKNIFQESWLDNNYTLFSKVKVRDIIGVKPWSYDTLKRTNQWHFDFLICDDRQAFRPILAIELDDNSHTSEEVQERDRLKNLLCEQVDMPLIRVYNSNPDEDIKIMLLKVLNN